MVCVAYLVLLFDSHLSMECHFLLDINYDYYRTKYMELIAICDISAMKKLENLNLSFTRVSDRGLGRIAGLVSLTSLNLDTREVTDAGLAALTSKGFQSICKSNIFWICIYNLK